MIKKEILFLRKKVLMSTPTIIIFLVLPYTGR